LNNVNLLKRKLHLAFEIIQEDLNGLKLIKPQVYEDERGFFMESYREDFLAEIGINERFVQDNHSKSQKNVLRGMHFQWDKPLGKLIRVTSGSAKFVELDIRRNSKTLGEHKEYILDSNNKHLLWVPFGFANSFLSLEDNTEVLYKCTAYWNPKAEAGILYNDPALNINWGIDVKDLIISPKDQKNYKLAEWLKRDESELV
jgi:dTDP-4-dehydrorhamnose 3,5-epimerase